MLGMFRIMQVPFSSSNGGQNVHFGRTEPDVGFRVLPALGESSGGGKGHEDGQPDKPARRSRIFRQPI